MIKNEALENKLKESENRYRALMESASDQIFMFNERYEFVSVNSATARQFGKKPDEIIGKHISEVFPKEIAAKNINNLDSVFKTGRNYSVKEELSFGGHKIYVSTSLSPVKNMEGKTVGVLGVVRDITEHRNAGRLIRESEEKFKAIFDNANDGFLVASAKDKKFILGNKAICEMTGYSLEEIKNLSIMDIHPQKDLPYVIGQFEKQAKKEIKVSANLPVKRKDGSVFYADVNASPVTLLGETYLMGVFRDVTERKEAEEKLRVRDWAIESSANAIVNSDIEGNLTYVNPAFLKLWGYSSRAEVLGKPAVGFWQMGEKAAEVMEAVRTKGGWSGEMVARRKDGTLFNVYVTSSMIVNDAGQPVCMQASFLDITERDKVEQELRDSEEKFKALLDSAPDAFFVYDGKGVFFDGNKAAEKLSGYRRDELIGKSFLKVNLLPPDQLIKGVADLAKNAMGIKTEAREYTLNRKDGTKVVCEINSTQIKIKGRTYILGIARDLTERNKAEMLLRESEEKFKAIFDNANDGFLMASAKDKKFTDCNKAICEMTGYTPEEIKTMEVIDIHPKEDLPYIIDQFEKQAKKEIKVSANLPVKRKDGSIFYADVNASPVTLFGEIYLLGIFRDITERKAAEAARKELLHKVEEANRNKTLFVSDVSHELRTPLASIKGFISTISSDPAMDEPTRMDFLRIAEEETDRLTRIIDDLLDISRVESGRLKLTMQSFNIIDLIMKNIDHLKPQAESREINIKSELSSSQHIVYADEDKSSQVITNLLSNAIKYNKQGGKVVISAVQENGKVRVNIEDTGIGIADKDLPRIFEKFFRADEASAQVQGTGLGLTVTKGLVESMGGELAFKSKHGEGSNFSFTLPGQKQEVKA